MYRLLVAAACLPVASAFPVASLDAQQQDRVIAEFPRPTGSADASLVGPCCMARN